MSKRFAWTLYDDDINPDELLEKIKPHARYVIFQKEKCPTTDKEHYQGYIALLKASRMSALKTIISPKAHFEKCNGTEEDNVNYCSKEDSRVAGPWSYGRLANPGTRNDINECKELLKNGASMREISEKFNYQCIRLAEKYKEYHDSSDDIRQVKVLWFWGGTGLGKTRVAIEMSRPDYWISGKNLKWWNGYDGHENVIIDDFRGDYCTFHELLRILDIYRYTVEVKGGFRQLKAKQIIITSCHHPENVYKERNGEDINQLLRRITEIKHFKYEEEYILME